MEKSKRDRVRMNPVIRALGAALLGCLVAGSYLAAKDGDITALIVYLGIFLFLAPPVIIGRIPWLLKVVSAEDVEDLNEDVFKLPKDSNPIVAWSVLVTAFCISAAVVMLLTQ